MNNLLENKNLRLRAIEPEDMELLYRWENDTSLWLHGASITPFSRYIIKQYLIDAGQDLFERKQLRLMIDATESQKTVGTIDLYDFEPFHRRAGVGILIDTAYRHQGFGHEALRLLENYCFTFLKLKQLYAVVSANNIKSIQLFEKTGYKRSGTLKAWLSTGDSFTDSIFLQRINDNQKL